MTPTKSSAAIAKHNIISSIVTPNLSAWQVTFGAKLVPMCDALQ